jgi:septal ring factor EnvC (AmiA/AmiB activator)
MWIAILFASAVSCCAQLTASDSLFISQLQRTCELNSMQIEAVDTLVKSTAIQLKQLDKELNKVSRSSLSDDDKNFKQNEIRKQKKEVIEGRDMAISFLLDERQRSIFNEQVKPSKPAVLHMGMNHDRANCNVCVSK